MKIIAVNTNRAVLTGARTEKFLKVTDFDLSLTPAGDGVICKDPRSSLVLFIPMGNIDYIQYTEEAVETKPVGRPRKNG